MKLGFTCVCDCVLSQSAITSSIYEGAGLLLQENESFSCPIYQNPEQNRTPRGQVGCPDCIPDDPTSWSDGPDCQSSGNLVHFPDSPDCISDGPNNYHREPTSGLAFRTVRGPARTVRLAFSVMHCFGCNLFTGTRIWTF